MRFHASGSAYDPFAVNAGVVTTRPLELGLLFAARLLAAGAVLRAIPNAGSLDAVAITRSDGSRTIVLSNYAAAPRWVSLATAGPVKVAGVLASTASVRRTAVRAVAGRARVELAPNSVEAITAGGS